MSFRVPSKMATGLLREGPGTRVYVVETGKSIQAAINQAVADGASPAAPALIWIAPGPPRVENLTLTGGGLTLSGMAQNFQNGTAWVVGTINCVDPGLTLSDFPGYLFQGMFLEGAITISGIPTPTNRCPVIIENCVVTGAITNTINGALVYVYNDTSLGGLTSGPALNCRLVANSCNVSGDYVVDTGDIAMRGTGWSGKITIGPNADCTLTNCSAFNENDVALDIQSAAGQVSRIYNCAFERQGTTGAVVTSAPTAVIRQGGNFAQGALSGSPFPTIGVIAPTPW